MVWQVEELSPCPDAATVAAQLVHLPHLLFLDSAERHDVRGRFSYVMADPVASRIGFESGFPSIDIADTVAGLPPFQGGWAGVLSYELGREFECQPLPRHDDLHIPRMMLHRYEWVMAFDHDQNRAWAISRGRRAPSLDLKSSMRPVVTSLVGDLISNFSRADYLDAVRRCVEYIHAGDIFQVNLSQRFSAAFNGSAFDLYCHLRHINPAPFAGYYDGGDVQILSASPERFLSVDANGGVVTQPIKGTRRRGRNAADDSSICDELMHNAKDRAENVMIVDLLRNDLGRVCKFGSVHVAKLCALESYAFVHHLVSEVRGKLRRGNSAFELLRAAFPGGSITGAPKVRAMEIIAELEPVARGPYCGSMGWLGDDGAMDTNILIRTMVVKDGRVHFNAGGGIVADSVPELEYEETLHKAAGLRNALESFIDARSH